MAKTRVAINGFGRIGRLTARIILQKYKDQIDLVAINDPAPLEQTALLFEFDSSYGKYPGEVEIWGDDSLKIDGDIFKVFSTRNIEDLPWKDLDVDVVLECTGVFRTKETASKHLEQGAKKVLLSAPAKSEGFRTIVLGVNDGELEKSDVLVSNASCTTNGLAPVAKVLDENFGLESGIMTTIHSYTGDQRLLDVGHKDLRRARAAALSMIPTTTGAAKAVGLVLPHLDGKLTGTSIRIPTPTVSLVDLTVKLKKEASVEAVNKALKKASDSMPHILGYEDRPLVSIDYKGDDRSSIVDASSTLVIGDQVKILAWYDNEWGYSCRYVELATML